MNRGFIACVGTFLAAGCIAHVDGQTLINAGVSKPAVQLGEEFSLMVEFQAGVTSGWCGIRIDFGNGSVRDFRVGENGAADFPLRVPHRYPSAGAYAIKVTGQALSRGLRSVSACDGGERLVNVLAEDPAMRRMKEDTELRRAQIEQYEARIRQLEQRDRAAGARDAAGGPAEPGRRLVEVEIPKDQYDAKWCSTSASTISVCLTMNTTAKVSKAQALLTRAACDAAPSAPMVVDADPPASGSIYTFLVPNAASFGCASFVFFTQR